MAYDILINYITQNRSYKALTAKGTVVHETATPGASDENEQKYFNSAYRGASAHAFVDCDSITQTIPWTEQSWHAGPMANRNYIGIELCHYDDEVRFNEVWKRAVWIFAYVHVNVLKITSITKENLMSHAEVSAKWKETNHTDPVAYFAKFGKTVDQFREAVQEEINKMLKPKKYYVVTNYLPSTQYGVEFNALYQRYFTGVGRIYLQNNINGICIETQYLSKDAAERLAERLKQDNLLWELVEE